jgi:DNA repair exonuclease SbcCD ATPase subunit
MRGQCVCVMLTIVPAIAWAASDGIPKLDVRPVCRGIASQSADPGVGQRSQTETFQQCIESEQAVLEQLKQGWSGFSAEDRRHCVTLATTGGESSNTELLTCLEMARDVRALRSAASGAQTTKPAPSLSMPPAQPTTAVPALEKEISKEESPKQETLKQEALKQEVLKQEVLKREANEAKSEVERAKLEAQTAKASEAQTQRKLADAEAALKKAKEEAQRASAEVQRAKADAQNARESEAAIKTKLADAEVARSKAEQACRSGDTQPSLGTRLRRWLGRPGSPNP